MRPPAKNDPFESYSDEALLRLILDRKRYPEAARSAFETLYRRYVILCRRHDYRLLHSGQRSSSQAIAEAEDIVSQKFLKLLALERFNFPDAPEATGKSVVRSFLFTMDRNECISFLRHHKRVVFMEEDEKMEEFEAALFSNGYGEAEDPSISLERSEQHELIKRGLTKLSRDQLLAVQLWSQGNSHREIAIVMDRTEQQVRGYIWHGLSKLREQFEHHNRF